VIKWYYNGVKDSDDDVKDGMVRFGAKKGEAGVQAFVSPM
jgi:hypothetical protein